MDEQQPEPGDFDDEVYVRAWWQWFRHHLGTTPEAQQAAKALEWARDGVFDMVLLGDPESAVTLVHRLLHAPDADLAVVAETPLADLLVHRGPEVEQDVAGMCADSEYPLWRKAVGLVVLTDEERAAVPALAMYLPEP